ncbi:ImmA/IrrE family metallo-endopeptidase [Bradyrhizobium sp.]|uniref:ImmA/IrrE family metallo-endopeptidase n=1 Tax=Bradyrhizobium sp. TaxID=376 RepID=UPI0025C5ECE6|nr:ImmA/IrrE family metallo-endopeptidase [Bradyrhizobium sp.]
MTDKPRARAEARKLIQEFGIKSPPVPVERIARSLGVKVEYAPFDDELSGMAFIKNGIPMIGVNSLHHPNRQRFTLAHELAHIQLHRPELETAVHVDKGSLRVDQTSLRRDPVSATGTDSAEVEANAFAAELLMPEAFLSTAVGDRKLDLEDVDVLMPLAKKFRVSLMALQHRLNND